MASRVGSGLTARRIAVVIMQRDPVPRRCVTVMRPGWKRRETKPARGSRRVPEIQFSGPSGGGAVRRRSARFGCPASRLRARGRAGLEFIASVNLDLNGARWPGTAGHFTRFSSTRSSSITSNRYPLGSRKKNRSNGVSRRGSIDLGSMGDQAFLECLEFRAREADRDVAAVLLLEGRGLEARHLDQVQLLPGATCSQAAGDALLLGRPIGVQPMTSWKKAVDRASVAGRQRDVCQCHRLAPFRVSGCPNGLPAPS